MTEKHKQNISKSKIGQGKGKIVSVETRQKLRLSKLGNKNPNFGKIFTEEQRYKFGSNRGKKVTFSKKWKENIGKGRTGKCIAENHWNWKGGISRDIHSTKEPKYRKWRSDVFQRDNWTCQTCGKRGVVLQAHHIKSWAKYAELRYDLDNGVALCIDCHKLTNNYKNKK